MTNDEKIIYEYSIEKKETDSVVQSIIKKYGKTYYHIKKSCYLKIYLYFNLDDENSYFVKYMKGHLYWCSFFERSDIRTQKEKLMKGGVYGRSKNISTNWYLW